MATKRTRQMKDYQLRLKTKGGVEQTYTFKSNKDATTALKLLFWFSQVVVKKDKLVDSTIVVLDREKAARVDELQELASQLTTK